MYKTMTKMMWLVDTMGMTYKGVPDYSEESGLIIGFRYGEHGYLGTDLFTEVTQINLETGQVTKEQVY